MASTADMSNGRGALDFELKWLKFLRDAEEEYITRLIKVSDDHLPQIKLNSLTVLMASNDIVIER